MFEQLYIIAGVLYYIMFYHYSNFSIDLEFKFKNIYYMYFVIYYTYNCLL